MPSWIKSSKFIITAGSLLAVFGLFAGGHDVRALEIIVPAILAFYNAGNVFQDAARRKYGEYSNGTNNDYSSSPNCGDQFERDRGYDASQVGFVHDGRPHRFPEG